MSTALPVGAAAPNLAGQPVFGLPFDLSRARLRGAVLVSFWAPLSAKGTLASLAALTEVWPRVDAEAGGMVAVTRSPLETARDFVPRHHVLFPVLVDETGTDFSRWGIGSARGVAAKLRTARPAFVKRALSVMRNGQPLPEAHEDQLPAAFVVDAEGGVRHVWYGKAVDDVVDAEGMWAAAQA